MTVKVLLTLSAQELLGKTIDSQARKLMPEQLVNVVNKHSKLAASAGLVPVPGVDLVMGTANTVKMFKGVNNLLGLNSKGVLMKNITTGLLSALMARFTTAGVTSTVKSIPGVGQVTGALMSSVMQYILALFSAYVYFNALSLLVDGTGHINLDNLSGAMKKSLANKELLDKMTDAIKGNAAQLVGTVKEKASSWGCATADVAGKAAAVTKEKAGAAFSATKDGMASLAGSATKGLGAMGKSVKSLWRKKEKKQDND